MNASNATADRSTPVSVKDQKAGDLIVLAWVKSHEDSPPKLQTVVELFGLMPVMLHVFWNRLDTTNIDGDDTTLVLTERGRTRIRSLDMIRQLECACIHGCPKCRPLGTGVLPCKLQDAGWLSDTKSGHENCPECGEIHLLTNP
jgi:hypothetical protein